MAGVYEATIVVLERLVGKQGLELEFLKVSAARTTAGKRVGIARQAISGDA